MNGSKTTEAKLVAPQTIFYINYCPLKCWLEPAATVRCEQEYAGLIGTFV